MKLRNLSQRKLEFGVAIAFSLLIILLSGSEIGYIPISEKRALDMAFIPALFAAMIGGYRVGIPIAIAWTYMSLTNDASNLVLFPVWGLLLERFAFVIAAIKSYKWFRKKYQYSPLNVYRTVIVAITIKDIVASTILAYIKGFYPNDVLYHTWMRDSAKLYLLELALALLAMSLLIRHLRQVHILNGVKLKQK